VIDVHFTAEILITFGGLFLLGLVSDLASQRIPEFKDVILPVVLGSTVIFELIGPVVTRRVLIRMGEIQND